MIHITRQEQRMLKKLKAVMAAEQAETITEEMLLNVDPDQTVVNALIDKAILTSTEEADGYVITKEPLQVEDDDPEVEQAWENFRQVRGDGSMTKLFERNRKAEAATKKLEQVLFDKGRLVHMTDKEHGHIWVTEDKVQYWQNRGFKPASQAAVPTGL